MKNNLAECKYDDILNHNWTEKLRIKLINVIRAKSFLSKVSGLL